MHAVPCGGVQGGLCQCNVCVYHTVTVKKGLSQMAKLSVCQLINSPTPSGSYELWLVTDRMRLWTRPEMSFLGRVAALSLTYVKKLFTLAVVPF